MYPWCTLRLQSVCPAGNGGESIAHTLFLHPSQFRPWANTETLHVSEAQIIECLGQVPGFYSQGCDGGYPAEVRVITLMMIHTCSP